MVDDAPFLAVELEVEDGEARPACCNFRTNVDDWVACGPDHALRFEPEPETGGLKPYLHVRRDLWAKVTRALFYDLVELGEERDVDGKRMFGVASGGEFFAMAPADELEGFASDGRGAAERRSGLERTTSSRAPARGSRSTCRPRSPITQREVARGDLDLDPALWEQRRRHGDARRPPCWCRWSITPSRRCCSPCAPSCRAIPGRSRFPAARSIRTTPRPLAAALREAEEEIGLDARV